MSFKLTAFALTLVTSTFVAGSGVAADLAKTENTATAKVSQSQGKLKLVEDNSKVCMITNALFPVTQIPVKVEGKTYYGCCQACKAQLENEVEARTAVDPITGKKVDKAAAVIGYADDNTVVYFESKKSFEKFNQRPGGK